MFAPCYGATRLWSPVVAVAVTVAVAVAVAAVAVVSCCITEEPRRA